MDWSHCELATWWRVGVTKFDNKDSGTNTTKNKDAVFTKNEGVHLKGVDANIQLGAVQCIKACSKLFNCKLKTRIWDINDSPRSISKETHTNVMLYVTVWW